MFDGKLSIVAVCGVMLAIGYFSLTDVFSTRNGKTDVTVIMYFFKRDSRKNRAQLTMI